MARLQKEGSTTVSIRPGVRRFLDQDCPFSEAATEEIVKRQTAFEEVQDYVAKVYATLRQGADWKQVEVPECLVKAEQKAEQREAQRAKRASSQTSNSESQKDSTTEE